MNKIKRALKFIFFKLAELSGLVVFLYISYWYGRLVEIFLMGNSWCNYYICGDNGWFFYTLSGFGSLLVTVIMLIGLFFGIKYIIKKNWEWAGEK